MRLTVRALKMIIREQAYDLGNLAKVQWSDEYDEAIEFIMCQKNMDWNEANRYIDDNWVFDSQQLKGISVLFARDESDRAALAYMPDKLAEKLKSTKLGWYYRLGGGSARCEKPASKNTIVKTDQKKRITCGINNGIKRCHATF